MAVRHNGSALYRVALHLPHVSGPELSKYVTYKGWQPGVTFLSLPIQTISTIAHEPVRFELGELNHFSDNV